MAEQRLPTEENIGKHPEVEERARAVARMIDTMLNDEATGDERRFGFGLLVFEFGDGGAISWISNAQREGMTPVFHELLARWEGRFVEGEGHA